MFDNGGARCVQPAYAFPLIMSAHSESSLQMARDLLAQEMFGEAVEELKKVFEAEPQHVGALCLLADTVLRLGQPDQALALLSDAVQAGGPDPSLLEQMSGILGSLGRLDEEADFLMFAAEASPADARLVERAVSALQRQGRQSDAEALVALAAGL